ncbi:MAG: TasA family protein [Oscillospiraceae bacterium]|nr:TasA family protein [Oscillospiraceae bacterium]
MKKKIVLICMAAALCAMLIVGGTLAYFTDTEAATNVITMDGLDITLTETGASSANSVYGKEYSNIMPGDLLEKDPTVTNNDAPAYLRVKVEWPTVVNSGNSSDNYTFSEADVRHKVVDPATQDVTYAAGIDTAVWKKVVDNGVTYYYYIANGGVLATGASVTLFDQVVVPASWGNGFQGANFQIGITAEAIQTANIAFDAADPAASFAGFTA